MIWIAVAWAQEVADEVRGETDREKSKAASTCDERSAPRGVIIMKEYYMMRSVAPMTTWLGANVMHLKKKSNDVK